MRREYQIVGRKGSAALRQFLAKEGAGLLPMVELIEAGELAVEELVGQLGQATLEAVLAISAQQVAGQPLAPEGDRAGPARCGPVCPHVAAHSPARTPLTSSPTRASMSD